MREVLRIGLAISESLAIFLIVFVSGKTTTKIIIFQILSDRSFWFSVACGALFFSLEMGFCEGIIRSKGEASLYSIGSADRNRKG
jgi:hypothetical protein